MKALMKVAGGLVIAEVYAASSSKHHRCPGCKSENPWHEDAGWLECPDCGTAILKNHFDKLRPRPPRPPGP